MDIQKLKYFYTTAQVEHITRASEILHISQPSLTQAIHTLEFELGVDLFHRQGRRIATLLNCFFIRNTRNHCRYKEVLFQLNTDDTFSPLHEKQNKVESIFLRKIC